MKCRQEIRIVMACILLAGALSATAQEEKQLTLPGAIGLSLQNSKQLKTQEAKIEEATASLREAQQRRLPDAAVSGAYLRFNNPNVDLKNKNSNSSSGGGTSESPKITQAVFGMLNLSMPVYAGGKIRYGIESAALLKKAIELDAEQEKDAVVQNTIESFSNLFKAGSVVRLVREHLAQAKQREKELGDLEKNGLLARNDLLKAQLQTATIELRLADAENDLELANLNMNLMLGLPANTRIVLDTTGIERKEDTRALTDFLDAAHQARKDLVATDLRIQAAQSGVKSIKADMLPALKISGGYVAADIPHFLTVTNAVNIGAGVSYNIGSLWKTKAKVQQANAQIKQMEFAESILQDQVQLEVSRNYLNLGSNRKKIAVMARALEQANENYRIVKNKFDNNLSTLSDLLEADVARFQSGLAYTLSRADAFVAYHRLLQSAGLLYTEMNEQK